MSESWVTTFNSLDDATAKQTLAGCCASLWWTEQMLTQRPLANAQAMHVVADEAFDNMPREAWLEAFAGHPRIGDLNSLKMKFAGNRDWSAGEQSGVAGADNELLSRLQAANDDYFDKFGYTFIVCATGKSAAEMLAVLEARLPNDAATEINVAANEQRKITHLRLDKLASTIEGPKS